MPYYRHDISGVTLEMSHTRNVKWKMINVGTVIARHAISNPPSKESNKQTNRPAENSILETAASLSTTGVYG